MVVGNKKGSKQWRFKRPNWSAPSPCIWSRGPRWYAKSWRFPFLLKSLPPWIHQTVECLSETHSRVLKNVKRTCTVANEIPWKKYIITLNILSWPSWCISTWFIPIQYWISFFIMQSNWSWQWYWWYWRSATAKVRKRVYTSTVYNYIINNYIRRPQLAGERV